MGKLIKFLLGLVLALVLLVVAAAIILPLVVDPNDFRDEIIAEVKQATGRDLAIDGDIGLSVFPWLGVELAGLALSQPQGFGDEPFAAISRAQVRAKLVPLLKRRLEVDRVQLEGLRLALIRDADGRTNWQDLAQGEAGEAPAESAEPESSTQEEGLAALAIGGIDIADARVSWDDRAAGQKVTVADLSLETGPVVLGQPMDLRLGFKVDEHKQALSARVELQGRVTPAQGGQRLQVEPFELRLQDLSTAAGLQAQAVISAAIALDMVEQRYRVDGLRVESQAEGGPIPGGAVDALLTAALELDLAQDNLAVKDLNLQAAGLDLHAELTGTQIRTAPALTGVLSLKELSPRGVLERLGAAAPQTADPQALTRFGLSADLRADPKQAALENLKVRLDDSNLDGKARILLDEALAYRFDLRLDAIDLDRYLAPRQEQAAAPADQPDAQPSASAPAEPAAAGSQEPPLFPVDLLRQLDVDGSLNIGHLVVSGLKLDQVSVQLKAKGGDVALTQQVKSFYQGALGGSAGVNVQGASPRVRLDQQVKGVQAQPLVQDLTGKDRLTGTANLNLQAIGSGQTVSAIKRTLDGTLDLAFTEGTVKGFNLGRMLREAAAKLKGQSLPPDQEPNQTDFSEIKASAVITDGVLKNDDLSAKSPLFRVTGAGTVDIGRNTLDYKVKPVLVASLQGQGGTELEKLKGVPIPVHLTGSLDAPNWRIDIAEALTESQKARVKEKINQEIEKSVPKDLRDRLPGGLKGLLN
jgi:AsmA protein